MPTPYDPGAPGMNSEVSSSAKDAGKQPEGDVVQAREGHVRRADHQRHHPIAVPADHRRHQREEDHDQAVIADEHVEDFRIAENLQARIHQLGAHGHRKHPADHPADDGEDEVHRADVLVIGRVDPPPPAMRMVFAVGGDRLRCAGHDLPRASAERVRPLAFTGRG